MNISRNICGVEWDTAERESEPVTVLNGILYLQRKENKVNIS